MTVARLEAEPCDECCFIDSPESNQIAPMSFHANSSGASSLPEKRPRR
jgi:hypothetical protein